MPSSTVCRRGGERLPGAAGRQDHAAAKPRMLGSEVCYNPFFASYGSNRYYTCHPALSLPALVCFMDVMCSVPLAFQAADFERQGPPMACGQVREAGFTPLLSSSAGQGLTQAWGLGFAVCPFAWVVCLGNMSPLSWRECCRSLRALLPAVLAHADRSPYF